MRTILLLLASWCLGSSTTFAQENQMALRFNLFSPVLRTFTGYVEKASAKDRSVVIGISVTNYTDGNGFTSGSLRAYHILPEYRFYLENEALSGYYLAPFFRYQNTIASSREILANGVAIENKVEKNAYGAGICIGQQRVLKHISIDAFVGPFYNASSTRVTKGSPYSTPSLRIPFSEGITLRAGFTVGIAF